MAKKQDAPSALVTVISALDPLADTDRQWVLQSAASRFTLSVQIPSPGRGGTPGNVRADGGQQLGAQPPIGQQDAKRFIKSKSPQSDTQRVACLAYYLTHYCDTPRFKTMDITTLNTEARGPKFNVARAVDNASRAKCGYLSPVGKGEKQLASHGEDIVEALPDTERVKQLDAGKKKVRRGARKKGTKRKSKTA